MHGVARHRSSRSSKQAGGVTVGSVSGSATTQAEVDELVQAADAAARAAAPAEDAARRWSATAPRRDWADESAATGIEVYDDVAPGARRGVRPGRRRRPGALRLRQPRGDHDLPRLHHRAAAAARPADRATSRAPARRADLTNSAWVGRATRDFTDVDPLAVDERARPAARLGRAPRRPRGGPLRHDPPADRRGRPDDLRLLGRPARATRGRASRSTAGAPTGTRIGEDIARPEVTLSSDPAYAGLECAPFVVASASVERDARSSTTASRSGRTDWIRARRADRAAPDPAHRRDDRSSRSRRRSTTWCSTWPAAPGRSRTSSPAPSAGCC